MSKRGDVWISAVIYIAMSIIAITLIISAGVPLINKVRDRNTFQQTKEVMHTIDAAIQEVLSEGPGSRRYLSPVIINKGELYIRGRPYGEQNKIVWTMETKALLIEPGRIIREGNLKLALSQHNILADTYVVNITMDYFDDRNIWIDIAEEDKGAIRGKNSIVITNIGTCTFEPSCIKIDVS